MGEVAAIALAQRVRILLVELCQHTPVATGADHPVEVDKVLRDVVEEHDRCLNALPLARQRASAGAPCWNGVLEMGPEAKLVVVGNLGIAVGEEVLLDLIEEPNVLIGWETVLLQDIVAETVQ